MVNRYFKAILAIIIPFLIYNSAYSQKTVYINLADIFPIQDFKLEDNNGLKIQALKPDGSLDKSIEGKYKFVINGYIEKLDFTNGSANLPSNLDLNSVIYIKHESKSTELKRLFYNIAGYSFNIPFWVLWLIPAIILLVVIIIKRFIYLTLIILVIVFFIAQGLDLSDYFALIWESFKQIFNN